MNTPLEALIAHYTSKANKNRKAIAASIYQDVVNYCTDLLPMEREYFINGYIADAQAFITAASITDPTQQSAINQLVVDLKGYGVWTKMQAIYPFVGGTSTSTSYNLKNTAQFQISWKGEWHLVASIPEALYYKMKAEGKIDD